MQHPSWPKGFWEDPTLLKAQVRFFNEHFESHTPVLPSHIAVAPCSAGSIDALLYNICDPVDGVLLPTPHWSECSYEIPYSGTDLSN